MIRAVLFDLDDTLFDHQHCARTALLGVRDLHSCLGALEAETLEQSHAQILEELHEEVMARRLELDAARIERFRRLFEAAGHQADAELAAQAAGAYRAGYLEARREVSGAAALLADVRRRARVVIVSNNLLEEQRGKLRHCGLETYVDALVVSEEVGVAKPHPAIFRVALERAGCEAHEAVMVGDSWTNDVEGARAVGIRPVWFSTRAVAASREGVDIITSLEPTRSVLETIFVGREERLGSTADAPRR